MTPSIQPSVNAPALILTPDTSRLLEVLLGRLRLKWWLKGLNGSQGVIGIQVYRSKDVGD